MTKLIDISHERGDSFSRILTLSNGVATSSFNEVWFTVRAAFGATAIVDETGALSSGKLTTGQITSTGYSEWTINITSPNWTVGRLVYDVQARTATGQIFTIVKGTLRVFDDVTRSV